MHLPKCANLPLAKLHVQFLSSDVFSIEKACDEISNSVRLRKLFGIVLNIGNRLNTAGPGQKRKAGAFSIKSLLKLNQAKAFDNKTTFLHYVVLVVRRNSEKLLDFKDDLPTVFKADKIYWDQCVSELEEVETQLENVRKIALHEAKSSNSSQKQNLLRQTMTLMISVLIPCRSKTRYHFYVPRRRVCLL